MIRQIIYILIIFLLLLNKTYSDVINFENCKFVLKSNKDKKDKRWIKYNKERNFKISINTDKLIVWESWSTYTHPNGQIISAGTSKKNIIKFDDNKYVSEKEDVLFQSGLKMQFQYIYLLKEKKRLAKSWEYKKNLLGNEKLKLSKRRSDLGYDQCSNF